MFSRIKDYEDLFYIFVWREMLIRYKQTILGVLWALLQPVSMMILFVVVFGLILNINTNGHPRALFYFAGLVPWTFFASSVSVSINSLTDNRGLITKIYFPRELIIFSKITVLIIDLLISFLLLICMICFYDVELNVHMIWAIPLLGLLFCFTAAVSILLATINVYYRDVKLASGFLLRLWFFATPVFYSVDTVSLKMKWVLFLNPLTYIVENFRRVLIDERGVVLWQFGIEFLFVVFLFIFSYMLIIRAERAFADVI